MDRRSADLSSNEINKLIKDDKRLSKHSSIHSEVDLAVAETSISEAVVETVSTESFATLETGTTVKLSMAETKENKHKSETGTTVKLSIAETKENKHKSETGTIVKLSMAETKENKDKSDTKENNTESASDNTRTEHTKEGITTTEVENLQELTNSNNKNLENDKPLNIKIPDKLSSKTKEKDVTSNDKTKHVMTDKNGNEEIKPKDVSTHPKKGKDLTKQPSIADQITERAATEIEKSTQKNGENQADTIANDLSTNTTTGARNGEEMNASERESNRVSKGEVHKDNANKSHKNPPKSVSKTEADIKSNKALVQKCISEGTGLSLNKDNSGKASESMQIVTVNPTSVEQRTSEVHTSPAGALALTPGTQMVENSQNITDVMTEETTNAVQNISVSPDADEHEYQASPEAIASVAKAITTTQAKKKVDETLNVTSQMIGSTNNALTLYNGSTLDIADVDYFVIFKAEGAKQVEGISFYARMELGTNSIAKVIPVSPTKAWVSYYGGGVKLVDTEKETVVDKIEVPDIDTIATTDESFLFVSFLGNSRIERLHRVGKGVSGSSPLINLPNCRIACMCMANSGKSIMLCIEKRHSCLCIPKKSEIAVQIHELTGKRSKELKPKVNGRHTPMTGFPIVMCENLNRDICIATFSNVNHTCAVEVYSDHLERKFVYEGDKTLSPRFMCEDICTDKQGNILILDNSLKAVHIVSKDGILAKIITTPKYKIEKPKCINLDSNGRLWIGQGPPAQMIILEYSVLPASL